MMNIPGDIFDRRSIRTTFVVLLGLLTLAATTATSYAAYTGPSGNQPVPNKFAPYESGKGYWLYVCKTAEDAGYTGDLNKAFRPYLRDQDQKFSGAFSSGQTIEPSTPRYILDDSNPAAPAYVKNPAYGGSSSNLQNHFQMWDNCRSSAGDPSFGVRRLATAPGSLDRFVRPDRANQSVAQGDLGVGWQLKFKPVDGLAISKIFLHDQIRSYKTTQTDPATPVAPGWTVGWGLARESLSGDRGGDQFRVCRPFGTWADGRRANGWWKDITSDTMTGTPSEWADENFSTTSYGSFSFPWYEATGAGPGDYYGNMKGTASTEANPDSRCEMKFDEIAAGSGREWYWSEPAQGIHKINMFVQCSNSNPSHKSCRSLDPADSWKEGPKARDNAINWGNFVEAKGAVFFVEDARKPVASITGGTLNRNGTIANDGTITRETLTYTASDNAGIRRMVVSLSGPSGVTVLEDNYNRTSDGDVCDYRYTIPCAGGTAVGGPNSSPPWSPTGQADLFRPIAFNADDLPPGSYSISVVAYDASNHASDVAVATFKVDFNLLRDCTGTIVTTVSTLINCGSTQDVCEGGTCLPSPTGATDPTPTGPTAPPVAVGDGIFTYGLAFNDLANGVSPAGNECKVIERVVSGNGAGGQLNDREKNQIISVTLDLSGYAARGTSIGTQDARVSFDLPSRRDSRYRNALGCETGATSSVPPTPWEGEGEGGTS